MTGRQFIASRWLSDLLNSNFWTWGLCCMLYSRPWWQPLPRTAAVAATARDDMFTENSARLISTDLVSRSMAQEFLASQGSGPGADYRGDWDWFIFCRRPWSVCCGAWQRQHELGRACHQCSAVHHYCECQVHSWPWPRVRPAKF